jgi:hypothetical protein
MTSSCSDLVPFKELIPLLIWPLLHLIVQLNASPSESLIRILQIRLGGVVVERLAGIGDPKIGAKFPTVVKMNHFLVYRLLPV